MKTSIQLNNAKLKLKKNGTERFVLDSPTIIKDGIEYFIHFSVPMKSKNCTILCLQVSKDAEMDKSIILETDLVWEYRFWDEPKLNAISYALLFPDSLIEREIYRQKMEKELGEGRPVFH